MENMEAMEKVNEVVTEVAEPAMEIIQAAAEPVKSGKGKTAGIIGITATITATIIIGGRIIKKKLIDPAIKKHSEKKQAKKAAGKGKHERDAAKDTEELDPTSIPQEDLDIEE